MKLLNDNRDTILNYIQGGEEASGIVLSDIQKELLLRWRFADELIRSREVKRREKQSERIMDHFGVNRSTAYRDILNAEFIFSSSCPLNKKYWIQVRIDFMEQKIDEMYEKKEYEVAARLETSLQKYIEMYPEAQQRRSPKNIIFNVQQNLITSVMTPEQAIEGVAEVVELLKGKDDY